MGGVTRFEVSAHFMFWFALVMFLDTSTIMKRPNPLSPDKMTPAERRAELCSLLTLGLVRLRQRDQAQNSDEHGEIFLHYPADRSLHATPTQRRNP